ncbi:MAG: DUF3842 family protein [Deltaproteobacteria bacterium]|nr:DUF3842 family protein [Candidatus Tharpellaceae bacterium]
MRIGIIDGQGGGIGSAIIRHLKEVFGEKVEIWALGTNAIATAAMMKARANRGATGENAIIQSVVKVDMILGTISIIMAHAMMGELTPAMATAIAASPAKKLLLPLSQENIKIIGIYKEPLPHLIDLMVKMLQKEFMGNV